MQDMLGRVLFIVVELGECSGPLIIDIFTISIEARGR